MKEWRKLSVNFYFCILARVILSRRRSSCLSCLLAVLSSAKMIWKCVFIIVITIFIFVCCFLCCAYISVCLHSLHGTTKYEWKRWEWREKMLKDFNAEVKFKEVSIFSNFFHMWLATIKLNSSMVSPFADTLLLTCDTIGLKFKFNTPCFKLNDPN